MCGKLLEIALKYYINSRSDEELPDTIGLGKLIAKVVADYGVQLDEGLKVLVNFINKLRIVGVHSKAGFEIPTDEQAYAVVLVTYDTIKKLFGEVDEK